MIKFAHTIITLNRRIPRFRFSSGNWQNDENMNKKDTKSAKQDNKQKTLSQKQEVNEQNTGKVHNTQQKNNQKPDNLFEKKQSKNRQRINDNYDYDNDQQPQFQRQDRTTFKWILYRIFFWSSTALFAYQSYLVFNHQKPTPVQDQKMAIPGIINIAKAFHKQYISIQEFLTQPPTKKLLPDIIHPQIQPKTLVLNVTGTLLESQYVFQKGIIVKKRPGLHQFLTKMAQLYQVVIFSNDDSMHLNTLIPSLDPRGQVFTAYFGQQCMSVSKGGLIKDLKFLNRDLKKVIVIDKNKLGAKQKQNVITLSEYKGDESDRELIQLTRILERMAKPDIEDVRKMIDAMGEKPLSSYETNTKQKIKSFEKSPFSFFSSKAK